MAPPMALALIRSAGGGNIIRTVSTPTVVGLPCYLEAEPELFSATNISNSKFLLEKVLTSHDYP